MSFAGRELSKQCAPAKGSTFWHDRFQNVQTERDVNSMYLDIKKHRESKSEKRSRMPLSATMPHGRKERKTLVKEEKLHTEKQKQERKVATYHSTKIFGPISPPVQGLERQSETKKR